MNLLFCDETNRQESETIKFFIYGGIIVGHDNAKNLSKSLMKIHHKYGYDWKNGQRIKFNLSEKPKSISKDDHKGSKKDVLKALIENDVKAISIIVHHKICGSSGERQKLEFTSGALFECFNRYLDDVDDIGIVCADNWACDNVNSYFSKIFNSGISFYPNTRLDNIIAFTQTGINHSLILSAADVMIGSLRYCINSLDKTDAPRAILKMILPLMWCRKEKSVRYILEKGIDFRPRTIKAESYRIEYDKLKNVLKEHIQCINSENQ